MRVRAVLTGAVALLAAGAVAPAPAGAVTGGEPTGEAFGNVGLILFYDDGLRYRCTATLVEPDVLLTAAHCTYGVEGGAIVTFDPDVAKNGTEAAANIPVAADPTVGYTRADIEGESGWYIGDPEHHPEYSNFTDMDTWNDVGAVLLTEDVQGVTPAEIAPVGYLDAFQQPVLNHAEFTLVGYGTEVRKPVSGPQKPTPMSYPLLRRYTEVVGQKLTPQILQVNGNENDTRGGGGSCFGDSGGPTFNDEGQIITVTSYGYTANCRYIDGLQRVDIAGVQDWLADVVDNDPIVA